MTKEEEFEEMMKHAEEIALQEQDLKDNPHGPQNEWDGENLDSNGDEFWKEKPVETFRNPNCNNLANTTVNAIIESSFTHDEYMGWLKGSIIEHRLMAGKNGTYVEDMAKADQYQFYYDEYIRKNIPKGQKK